MTRKPIAFATIDSLPNLTPDDRLAATALKRHGLDVVSAVWDDPQQHWADFSAVIVRSCWNYHKKPAAFLAWIDALTAQGVALFNPPDVLSWNSNKRYLFDLADAGVAVPPTVLLSAETRQPLATIVAEQGWTKAVVKPTVSATAFNTFVTTPDSAEGDDARIDPLLTQSDLLVQAFQPAIQTEGEYSLIFFGDAFSHAVLKTAAAGDFRVQSDFGGRSERVTVDDGLISAVVAQLQPWLARCLYTRVDIIRDDPFLLMELEQIEPYLFFSENPDSADRFARQFLQRMEAQP